MPTWNELFQDEQFIWKDPHPKVVALAAELKRREASRVLDLGCGAGRHTVFLAREGFAVCGSDVAERGLAHTRAWLAREGLRAALIRADMTALPHPDRLFDAVISTYVIYHNPLALIQRSVDEIQRVLRPSGLAFLTLISTRASKYGQGEEIEPHTFIPTAHAEEGVVHHYFDEARARALLADFRILELALEEHEWPDDAGRPRRHSHW
ncbi:MAG TPA: class I SAM-dependent methyltransferase [Anaerolineae bacterium]|nr:class I SAM-dependent methyltransferase [Anaerolineae bacterium]